VAKSPEAESLWNYRNKIELVMERSGGLPQLGYRMDNGRILDIPYCKLAHAGINDFLAEIRQDPGFMSSLHRDMRLSLRTDADGMVHARRNSAGSKSGNLRQILPDGKDFFIPADGFFQVNPHGLRLLWEEVGNIISSKGCRGIFVDAYAGSGFFSCCAAAHGAEDIMAVESQKAAAETALQNFALRGREDIRITAADAEVFLQETLPGLPEGSAVLIDPPRRGISGNTLAALAGSRAERIIYVSCDPATLTRDLGGFVSAGFVVAGAKALPMFPRCAAFETVVELERV
jgi:tRNA/tmRNA/rRNA uracil-C5-methylase (TrmA/RlmC/RlmD family)